MSRSYIRDKWIQKHTTGRSFISSRSNLPIHNPHRQDEMPQNHLPKHVSTVIPSMMVDWLQDSTSYGGHSRPKGGHRRVSGIVRARTKKQIRAEINNQISE